MKDVLKRIWPVVRIAVNVFGLVLVGYVLYLAAVFGLLGPQFTPKTKNPAQQALAAELRKSLHEGMSVDEAKAEFQKRGVETTECVVAHPKWTLLPGISREELAASDCHINASIMDTGSAGIVRWNAHVTLLVKAGRVHKVVFKTMGTGP